MESLNVSQSQTSEPLEQIMSCLQTLSSNMQSMSTEVRSISSRLERVEERQEEESETSNPVSAGPARRASTDPSFSTPLESRVSSGLSWAETMEQEETSNPDGSMEVEEAAGEEPSTGGIKLFTLADKAEAFIRPACLSPLPNSTRRQLVERFGKPSLPCTSAPYLDKVLRPRLPAPVRARDNELAKIQAMSLDGMFPLCRLLNDAHSGELHLPEIALDAVQTSIRLLGSVTAHCNRLRRTSALQSLNPGIVDMAEEDAIFKDAGLRLFGEGFSEKAKKRDDELRALDKVSGNSSGGKRRAQNAGSQASFFPRAKTQNGKHRHFSGSGRGRPRYGPYPQATSSKKDRTPK